MRRIVHSIHENLPEVVNGNFNDVRQIIEKVNGAVESDQSIEEILKLISIDTIKNKGVATEELIEKLNHNLNVQETEQLHKGTLSRFVCSLDHEWLHLPSVDEYQTTGIDRVRVGGELQDGKRGGRQIVDVKEWLDMVREKWGIEKPKSAVQAEDDKQANGAET